MSPRVSVVMPVWNVEPYLRECMDSILNQTMGDFEFICIDDASDDGSPAILAEYAARDKRVKLLRTEHEGAYVARAAGIKVATGEFLYFMDSDDVLDTNAFKELLEIVDSNQLDQIIFSAEVFSDEVDQASFEKQRAAFERYYTIAEDLCNKVMSGPDLMFSLERAKHFFVSPPFRLTKLTPLKERDYPFPHGAPFHADEFYTPVSLYFSKRAMIVSRRYYKRRVRPGSISTVTDMEAVHFTSLLNVMAALCQFKPILDDLPIRRADLAAHMYKLTRAIMRRSLPLDAETQTELLGEIRVPLPPAFRFFLATCYLPLIAELHRTEVELAQCMSNLEKARADLGKKLARELQNGRTIRQQLASEFKDELDRVKKADLAAENQTARARREVLALKRSASYRVGMVLTWPLRGLYRLLCGKKD